MQHNLRTFWDVWKPQAQVTRWRSCEVQRVCVACRRCRPEGGQALLACVVEAPAVIYART
jgi:hypothetical protein